MNKDELKIYVDAFKQMLETTFIPQHRQVETSLKFLEKGRVSIRGKVTYPDFGVVVDLICCRDKKDRDQYQQENYRLAFTQAGKTESVMKEAKSDIRETFGEIIADLLIAGIYTIKIKEE